MSFRRSVASGALVAAVAICAALPEPRPAFIARIPFGYHDGRTIESDLGAAGFTDIAIERVERASPPGSAIGLARGMCLGSPLANELAAHTPVARERAVAAAIEAACEAEEAGGGTLAMAALVVTARG